jgi:hypothetical protein
MSRNNINVSKTHCLFDNLETRRLFATLTPGSIDFNVYDLNKDAAITVEDISMLDMQANGGTGMYYGMDGGSIVTIDSAEGLASAGIAKGSRVGDFDGDDAITPADYSAWGKVFDLNEDGTFTVEDENLLDAQWVAGDAKPAEELYYAVDSTGTVAAIGSKSELSALTKDSIRNVVSVEASGDVATWTFSDSVNASSLERESLRMEDLGGGGTVGADYFVQSSANTIVAHYPTSQLGSTWAVVSPSEASGLSEESGEIGVTYPVSKLTLGSRVGDFNNDGQITDSDFSVLFAFHPELKA